MDKHSSFEWCCNQRDIAYSRGDDKEGEAYQQLASIWAERENKKGELNAKQS